jgi:hypothetical protein
MGDDEAFMQLVLSNTQGELSPLEIGMHALKAVPLSAGGRGQKGGLSAYAERAGYAKGTVSKWRAAADVVQETVSDGNGIEIADKTGALYEISCAPREAWPVLVESLVKHGWTVADAQHHVQQVKAHDWGKFPSRSAVD